MQARSSILVLLVVFPALLAAQAFPRINGQNLLGKTVVLPDAASGRAAILILGFSHASQNEIKTWEQRLEHQFDPAAVTVYPIAVLQRVPRLVRGMAVHGIKGDAPEAERGRFLLVYHGEDELKQAAGFQQPNDAYLIVLDPAGAVRWRFHGPVSDAALNELSTRVRSLESAGHP